MRDVWALSDPVRVMVRLTDMYRQWFRLDDFHRNLLHRRHESCGLRVEEEGLPRDVASE